MIRKHSVAEATIKPFLTFLPLAGAYRMNDIARNRSPDVYDATSFYAIESMKT